MNLLKNLLNNKFKKELTHTKENGTNLLNYLTNKN